MIETKEQYEKARRGYVNAFNSMPDLIETIEALREVARLAAQTKTWPLLEKKIEALPDWITE